MKRRDFLKIAGSAPFILKYGSPPATAYARTGRKPRNIILIITDQQHIDTFSSTGSNHVKTPALDFLQKRSTFFRNSYCANPLCGPARSALLTGRTSSEAGVPGNSMSIRKDIPNLGQWFREHSDYETVYIGKWHMSDAFTTDVPGFDVLCTGGHIGYIYDEMISRACEGFLRNRSSDRPFLLVVSFTQPHDICIWLRQHWKNSNELPYEMIANQLPALPANFVFDPEELNFIKARRKSNEPYKGQWERLQWQHYLWSYYRQIEDLDAEMGRVLQTCADFGRLDDTLLLFTSDHGEGLAHHQLVRKNTPYDETAKVPFLISWPGEISEDRIDTNHLVSGLDVVPTLCDYAGIAPPPDMRGISLRPILGGNAGALRPYVISEMEGNSVRMVRSERYKYVTAINDDTEMLFDMKKDPGEMLNLASQSGHNEIKHQHRTMLREWERGLDIKSDIPWRDAWAKI